MPFVDPSRRAVNATAAQQVARPKLSVIRVDNGDGSYSYYQQVYLAGTTSVNVEFDGESPQTDSYTDQDDETHVIPTYKLRLGKEGQDGGLVSSENPIPSTDSDVRELLQGIHEELEIIRTLLVSELGD